MPFLSMLWGIPLVRKLALYAGIALGLLLMVMLVFFNGKSAGKAAAKVDAMSKALAAEKRMKDAGANAPSDRDGVSKRLRDNKF